MIVHWYVRGSGEFRDRTLLVITGCSGHCCSSRHVGMIAEEERIRVEREAGEIVLKICSLPVGQL